MAKDRPISVRVSEAERELLNKAAQKEFIPLATYFKSAILKYTKDTHPELFKEEKN